MKPVTEQDYRERIVRTLVYIQNHLDGELDLDQAAAVAAFSKFHFHRIFRALVGETPAEHVRRLRLERAALRLKHSGDSVTQIAFEAGFGAHESFTRAFTEMFGSPPSAYRTAHAEEPSHYRLREFGDPPIVKLKKFDPMHVVFLRHTGPYDRVGATWAKLMAQAGARGWFGPAMKLIGISHDDPDVTPQELIRYDAAISVARAAAPEGEFGAMELAGGDYAVIAHRGPYEGLARTYQSLYGGWLPRSRRDLRDAPAFELYLNSPQNARPQDLLTEIHVPVI